MSLSYHLLLYDICCSFCFFFLMIRRPPRSTLFPTRRSSDLVQLAVHRIVEKLLHTPTVRVKELAVGGQGDDYAQALRSEEHTSELQSRRDLVCRLLLEKKKKNKATTPTSE